jgi:hypothetical protein
MIGNNVNTHLFQAVIGDYEFETKDYWYVPIGSPDEWADIPIFYESRYQVESRGLTGEDYSQPGAWDTVREELETVVAGRAVGTVGVFARCWGAQATDYNLQIFSQHKFLREEVESPTATIEGLAIDVSETWRLDVVEVSEKIFSGLVHEPSFAPLIIAGLAGGVILAVMMRRH